jgi:hypothetical protein
VDHEKTKGETVPFKPRGIDWTKLLSERGLESPGYQETTRKIREEKARHADGDVLDDLL